MHINKVTFNPEQYPDTTQYPFNLTFLREVPSITFDSPVTFFVGENGAGKTTVLKAACLRCGIHIWQNEQGKRPKHSPYEDELYRFIDVHWRDGRVPGSYFSSQIFHDFTGFLDEWAAATPAILDYFGGSSLVTRSHGQSLMAYFRSRYAIKGLYFLDEPEAALSPMNQLRFLDVLLENIIDGHAQFIIATQSPILLACPGASILRFDGETVRPVAYEDTEHFKIYRDFLNNPQAYFNAGASDKQPGSQ